MKEKARQLGFQLAGITHAGQPESFPVFEEWVKSGRYADMGYLADERSLLRRSNPRQILPECESILVLGIPYQPQSAPHNPIASYAWGQDYHEVLKPRLAALVAFLEAQVGYPIANRYYTDTGPVLERDLGQRAGLGWVGKNSMLINPRLGSYFFIAEILLGIEIPPDPRFATDHCGTCTRCLDACPTECILPDRTIDASRCVSYLTIENKGSISLELRPKLGEWVFGCDVCQQVCPWNLRASRKPDRDIDPAFAAESFLRLEDLHGELSLSPEAFNRKFKNSPVKRAKRRGYLRNIATALGNRNDPAAIPALEQTLQDDEPLVREHAAWALEQINEEDAA